MGNLVVLLYQVQALRNNHVVLVLVFSNLEQNLDHVLDALVDGALMQDSAESFENPVVGARRVLSKVRAYFTHETDSNLDRVVCWLFKKENQNLESNNFMRKTLVDEVRNKSSRRVADNLIRNIEPAVS